MASNYDVIVVGAGSNSLLTAGYLAKAGKNVLVLEKNDQCGGGVVSVNIAPGFIHDTHATGYGFVISPVIAQDELELMSKHGLKWVNYPAFLTTQFDTGETLTTYTDLDKTCADMARFSVNDAERYRDFIKMITPMIPLLAMGAATPPMPSGPFFSMMDSSAPGRRLVDTMLKSAYDIITELCPESHLIRIHLLKWVAEGMQNPEQAGTGAMFLNMVGLAHSFQPHVPVGGSRAITDSIIRCIEHHGSTVRTGAEVTRINISGGKATGVTLANGEVINAKEAVVGNIHPWRLKDVIPEIDPAIAKAARNTTLANHGALNQQIALSEWPKYKHGNDAQLDLAICKEFEFSDELEFRKMYDSYRYGELPTHANPLVITHSRLDTTRAPSPDHCALYLYHFAPRELLDGGLEGWTKHRQEYADMIWDQFKSVTTNIDDSKVIARLVESPLEHHKHSASFMNGDIFGIGHTFGQLMGRRPIVELSQFTIPGITSLYLVGPSQHPGGSVTFGGRAVAVKMMMDWKMDLKKHFKA